jgi:hypothetical protein
MRNNNGLSSGKFHSGAETLINTPFGFNVGIYLSPITNA